MTKQSTTPAYTILGQGSWGCWASAMLMVMCSLPQKNKQIVVMPIDFTIFPIGPQQDLSGINNAKIVQYLQ